MRYTAQDLIKLPTLEVGQTDDLKVDTGKGERVWLSRMTTADGMPYDNQVTVERYRDGRWVTESTYRGGSTR